MAIALKVGKSKKTWHPVAITGEWDGHSAGKFRLTRDDLEQIVSNFERIGLDIVVDYEHQSLYGGQAPAAGWIKHPGGLKVEGDTLLARIEWTKEAKVRIDEKEYRYLSPTLIPHYTDPKSGEDVGWHLHSVALTNTPFLAELPPVAAKNTTNKEDTMHKDAQAQIDALHKEIKALKNENETLKEELAKHEKIAATAKVEQAISARKLSPEQKEWAQEYALKDPAGFDAYLEAVRPAKEVPQNDMFAAKNNQQKEGGDFPVDAL